MTDKQGRDVPEAAALRPPPIYGVYVKERAVPGMYTGPQDNLPLLPPRRLPTNFLSKARAVQRAEIWLRRHPDGEASVWVVRDAVEGEGGGTLYIGRVWPTEKQGLL